MRKAVGTPGLERVPFFSAREQLAYVHSLRDGFPLRCWAPFCSSLNWINQKGSWGLPTGVELKEYLQQSCR